MWILSRVRPASRAIRALSLATSRSLTLRVTVLPARRGRRSSSLAAYSNNRRSASVRRRDTPSIAASARLCSRRQKRPCVYGFGFARLSRKYRWHFRYRHLAIRERKSLSNIVAIICPHCSFVSIRAVSDECFGTSDNCGCSPCNSNLAQCSTCDLAPCQALVAWAELRQCGDSLPSGFRPLSIQSSTSLRNSCVRSRM